MCDGAVMYCVNHHHVNQRRGRLYVSDTSAIDAHAHLIMRRQNLLRGEPDRCCCIASARVGDGERDLECGRPANLRLGGDLGGGPLSPGLGGEREDGLYPRSEGENSSRVSVRAGDVWGPGMEGGVGGGGLAAAAERLNESQLCANKKRKRKKKTFSVSIGGDSAIDIVRVEIAVGHE